MSTEIDFKSLWNKQPATDMPDTKEIFAKAERLKRKTRCTLIFLNLGLIATSIIVIYVGLNVDHVMLTTKIGMALMVIGMISYLVAYNQFIPLVFNTEVESNSHDYLNKLIRIKRKEDFLNKVMINIYFILLSTGLFLYMIQFAAKMSTTWAVYYYILTFGWMAFACFYLRPCGIKKKQKRLNDIIARLESINGQLETQ
jgi:hypothetical protein